MPLFLIFAVQQSSLWACACCNATAATWKGVFFGGGGDRMQFWKANESPESAYRIPLECLRKIWTNEKVFSPSRSKGQFRNSIKNTFEKLLKSTPSSLKIARFFDEIANCADKTYGIVVYLSKFCAHVRISTNAPNFGASRVPRNRKSSPLATEGYRLAKPSDTFPTPEYLCTFHPPDLNANTGQGILQFFWKSVWVGAHARICSGLFS